MKHYEVYLWPGANTRLSDCKPLTDSGEFWQQRDKVIPAVAGQVKDTLSQQGVNADDYVVLDHAKYMEWLEMLERITENDEIRKNNGRLIFRDKYLNCHNKEEMDKINSSISPGIWVEGERDYLRYLTAVPGLTQKIRNLGDVMPATLDPRFFDKKSMQITTLHPLESQGQVVLNEDFSSGSYSFSTMGVRSIKGVNCSFKKLIINLQSFCEEIDLLQANIENLYISAPGGAEGLTHLKLNNHIRKLELRGNLYEMDYLGRLSNLEELAIYNSYIALDFTNSNVKRLELVNCEGVIDLSQFPALEFLRIESANYQPIEIKNLDQLKHLKGIRIESRKPVEIDLSNNPQVDFISLKNVRLINADYKNVKFLKMNSDTGESSLIDAFNSLPPAVTVLEMAATLPTGVQKLDLSTLPTSLTRLTLRVYRTSSPSHVSIVAANPGLSELDYQSLDDITMDLSQFTSLTRLWLYNKSVDLKGRSDSLKFLAIQVDNKTTLDLDLLPDIEELELTGSPGAGEVIEIKGIAPKIKRLSCHCKMSVDLSRFDGASEVSLTAIAGIKWGKRPINNLEIKNPSLSYLDLSNAPQITHLSVSSVSSIIFGNQCNLKTLKLKNYKNKILDLSMMTDLELLDIQSNFIERVILPNPCKLKFLWIYGSTTLREVNITSCPELELLRTGLHSISKFDLTKCPKLKQFASISNEKIDSVYDFSGCRELRSIDIVTNKDMRVNVEDCVKLQALSLGAADNAYISNLESCRYLEKFELLCENTGSLENYIKSTVAESLPYCKASFGRSRLRLLEAGSQTSAKSAMDSEKLALDYINQNSRVSVYSPMSSLGVNANTGGKVPVFNNKDYKFRLTIHANDNVPKNYYRTTVFNRIDESRGKISAVAGDEKLEQISINTQPLTEQLIDSFMDSINRDTATVVHYLEVSMPGKELVSFPTRGFVKKNEVEIYTDPKDAIELLWDETKQEYKFKLKAGQDKVNILYRYRQRPVDVNGLKLVVNPPLLSNQLCAKLKARLDVNGSRVRFMFDPALGSEEKINRLIQFIKIEYRALDISSKPADDFDTICDSILELKGVCSQRGLGCMLLAHMIGVPLQIRISENHVVCEVPYAGKKGIERVMHDLGGGEMVDLTPVGARKDLLETRRKAALASPAPIATPAAAASSSSTLSSLMNWFAQSSDKVLLLDTERIFATNDPDLVTQQLDYKLDDPLIVDLTPDMDFSDLIYEQTQILSDTKEGAAKYSFIEKGVLKALKEGRPVIINGEMPLALYQQLLPYLDEKATILLNGEEVAIKGKLHLVTPQNPRINFSFKDYKDLFPREDQVLLERIEAFHRLALKMPHQGLGRPPALPLNYQRIQMLLAAIKNNQLHAHNPVKSVYLYDFPRHTMDYAYLNVMAKICFDGTTQNNLNSRKLNNLLKRLDLNDRQALRSHVWEVLNCFSGPLLNELAGTDPLLENGYPALSEAGLTKLAEIVQRYQANPRTTFAARDHKKKKRQIKSLLQDPAAKLIILKGPPGVGKSSIVKKLLPDCYKGEKQIIDFLENGGTLFLDEANMKLPGTWRFLTGLSRNKQSCYYKGKEYKVKGKILIAINPETELGRHHHSFFREYGQTVYMEKPEHSYLERKVLSKVLEPAGINTPEIRQNILRVYDSINAYDPLRRTSIRDLENLALRIVTLREIYPGLPVNEILYKGCLHEFAYSIKDPEMRNAFIKKAHDIFNHRAKEYKPPIIFVTPSHPLPGSKTDFVDAIQTKLVMRRQIMDGRVHPAKMKKCIIIQGESGIGKSTLYRAMIEREISRECNGDPARLAQARARWDFVEINAGTHNVRKVLIEAFYSGKIVIFNEINLDKQNLELINKLLDGDEDSVLRKEKAEALEPIIDEIKKRMGKDPQAIASELDATIKRNIARNMILASQNPARYAGRMATPEPLMNRSDCMYMEFTKAELETLSNPAYVSAYEQVRKERTAVNTRVFFTGLRKLAAPSAAAPAKKLIP